uniref:Zinc finger protein n=1 Tax=Marseillevirus sp. TaxID=2809551 RepID=A0AA96J3G1_9VIRU|nr:zinc finger protein [Marseillevirus sp.]
MDEYICSNCGSKFSSPHSLKLHEKTAKRCLLKSPNVELLECPYCEKDFPGQKSLERHFLVCNYRKKVSPLLEEISQLKEELSKTKRELASLRGQNKKNLSTKQSSLLDTENFSKEFFLALEKVPPEVTADGIKNVITAIKELTSLEEKSLWGSNKKNRTVYFFEGGKQKTETEQNCPIMEAVSEEFFSLCFQKINLLVQQMSSLKETYNILAMQRILAAQDKYCKENKKRFREFWNALL